MVPVGTHCRTVGMILSDCQKLLSDYCRTVGLLSEFTVGLSDHGSHLRFGSRSRCPPRSRHGPPLGRHTRRITV